MASDLLHIKDSYYFEVPKFLWKPNYQSLDDVPEFLLELHKDDFHLTKEGGVTKAPTEAETEHALHEFNTQMAGKILIPQPPGVKLKSLYRSETPFAFSKFMVLELAVAIFMILLFRWMAKKVNSDGPPKGRLPNLVESVMQFVRVDIVKANIHHGASKFLPLIWTIFFFVLFCDLLGLVPWMGTATAALSCTLALAFAVLVAVFTGGLQEFGPKWLWSGFVPTMDLHWTLSPLKVFIFLIEVLGMFIKHAVLALRLFANMAAGHLVLLAILGLVITAAKDPNIPYGIAAFSGVIGTTVLSLLELFVAVLQAYIFALLASLFIGSAVHEH
ncbi:F0F1 ATP synthase subunit A [Thalassoroseus pseudoceratinae]|uniref:F0F1 ATP synthase subunit A n=1 Tax=Thalassoroseus pseudoceratinae TaxID=2713176 RepID=UPI0014243AD0|nr:F0F1 ATP synthase subunit A [Thalassoroseus pseudoceratinae]